MINEDPLSEVRAEYLTVVRSLRAADFTPVSDFAELPGEIFFHSTRWNEVLFRPGKGPHHNQAAVSHAYHLAKRDTLDYDLVRHTYEVDDLQVIVTESAAFFHILLRRGEEVGSAGTDALERAAALASTFLNTPDVFTFRFTGNDTTYRAFSSHPTLTLTQMDTWNDRVDGTIDAKGLILLCYKVHLDLELFIDLAEWFPDDFRMNRNK